MDGMHEVIRAFLRHSFAIDAERTGRMSTGVGGDTYRVCSPQGDLVFKIVKGDDINHPEREAGLCAFLRQRDLPVSEFLPGTDGKLTQRWHDGRVCHLQRLIPGETFAMNAAPDWFMAESPKLLAHIHDALDAYPDLPEGIGAGFFAHMTPESVLHSYRASLATAQERGEEDVCEALNTRIRLAERHLRWRIDPAPLTRVNTHGDYTVNQILCHGGRIAGVIDWTSACVHPAVWELTRSYFYAAPECADGGWSEARLARYVRAYDAMRPLKAADHAAVLDVYLYQLLVCDYYAQYLHAAPYEAAEFRQQADFATRVLTHAFC